MVDKYDEPEAIVVFGSYARGDDIEKSDIDIAVITGEEKKLNLSKYEKRLNREIQVVEIEPRKAKKEFLNNLANGIVLHGYLRLL